MPCEYRPNGNLDSQGQALAGTLLFRNIPPLRVRGSVWHVCPCELPSGFCGNDCSGGLLSRFSGQTEWWGRFRLSRNGRCVGFSDWQATTINRITVATEISEKPPPFRLATLHYRTPLVFFRTTRINEMVLLVRAKRNPIHARAHNNGKDYPARARNDVFRTRRDAKFCISTTQSLSSVTKMGATTGRAHSF